MIEFFMFTFIVSMSILVLWIIKQKYFAGMAGMILAIGIFGSGYLWAVNIGNTIEKKTESISKSVYGVQQSIDRLGESVGKVNKAKDNVIKVKDDVVNYPRKVEDAVEDRFKNNRIINIGRPEGKLFQKEKKGD